MALGSTVSPPLRSTVCPLSSLHSPWPRLPPNADPSQRATPLNPQQWKEMIAQAQTPRALQQEQQPAAAAAAAADRVGTAAGAVGGVGCGQWACLGGR